MGEQTTPLTQEQIKSVKGQGFLHNKGTRAFSARILTENGMLTAEQMEAVCSAARAYGNGNITFTVRLTIEVQGVLFENIPAFHQAMQAAGLETGGTGALVRPVVTCKGTTCGHGLCDTFSIATEIHQRFYKGYREVTLPHKFKIALGGCPNNCVKPDLNDLGVVAQRVPVFDTQACKGCAKCGVAEKCPMGAVSMQDGKIAIDPALCNNCGQCVGACPFKIGTERDRLFKIYLGGKWGKKTRMGTLLDTLYTKDAMMGTIEKAILFFKKYGKSGERFGDTIDRLGIEQVEAILQSEQLLREKSEIVGVHREDTTQC